MPRRLSLLDDVRVATPCPANWDEMDGDARKRFCHQCQKHVYSFAEMREAEIVDLLTSEQVCGRLFRRADGTILTADCPTGLRMARAAVLRWTLRAAALALTLCGGAIAALARTDPTGTATDRFARSPSARALQRWIGELDPPRSIAVAGMIAPPYGVAVMGDVAPPPPPPPVMGKIGPPTSQPAPNVTP